MRRIGKRCVIHIEKETFRFKLRFRDGSRGVYQNERDIRYNIHWLGFFLFIGLKLKV
jgi:hypothetical protein